MDDRFSEASPGKSCTTNTDPPCRAMLSLKTVTRSAYLIVGAGVLAYVLRDAMNDREVSFEITRPISVR